MTYTQALVDLRQKHAKCRAGGMEAEIDEGTMFVFVPEPAERRDYGLFEAVQDDAGQWQVRQLVNLETGTTEKCRVWLTPREWGERRHGRQDSQPVVPNG